MLLIFVLILIHILGDFYLQPKIITDKKVGNDKILPNFKYLFLHVLIYTICAVCILPVISLNNGWNYLIIVAILFISHFLIDGFTCFLKKKIHFQSLVFLIDQLLHAIVLIGIGHLIFYKWTFTPWDWLITYQKEFEILVCILLLIKPSIIFVDIIFSDVDFNRSQSGFKDLKQKEIQPLNVYITINHIDTNENKNELKDLKEASVDIEECNNSAQKDKNDNSSIENKNESKRFDPGRVIGVAERLIAFTLILANAYAALALIITVKTWARQKEIQNVKGFGNKYLVGTLVSLAIAISIGFFCANVILKQ